jgi:hypothetical protein
MFLIFMKGLKKIESSSDSEELFPNAKFIMDATFQPIWTPIGTYNEKKSFYSGKHIFAALSSKYICFFLG